MAFIESQFKDVIQAQFKSIVLAIVEEFNGEKYDNVYTFRRFLNKRFSLDGTYSTMVADVGSVMADYISLDSPLPTKSRPSVSSALGVIPKAGIEFPMNETDLRQVRLLLNSANGSEDYNNALAMIFNNTRRAYKAILDLLQYRFEQGLSAGLFTASTDNVGLDIRVDYNFTNLYAASTIWGQSGYTAFQDIIDMVDDAGGAIDRILLDRATMNLLLNSDDAKNAVSSVTGGSGAMINFTQLNEYVIANEGFQFEIVPQNKFVFEVNSVKTKVVGWTPGQVIGITDDKVGILAHSRPEEYYARVGGKEYQEADGFVLLSKYRASRPSLKEWSDAQAVALPVIDANKVYKLDTTSVTV